jgi:hypothetical protein
LTSALLAAALFVVTWAWYQPVRNVVFNNNEKDLLLMEEHTSLRIAAKTEKDIGPPRGTSFQIGTEPMIGRIRFNDDGSVRYRAITLGIDKVVRPPESWAHPRIFWYEYHYRFDPNGELSLIPPKDIGVESAQPSGFPLCLDRVDVSIPNSGLTSQCNRPPAAADRGRWAASELL